MALNTTIGRSYSNSFVTLGEANVIMNSLPYDSTEWDALSNGDKEYRLRLAAQLLGMLSFSGTKPFDGQALCFPRDSQENMMIIPEAVKKAQVDLAYTVIHKSLSNLSSDVTESQPSGRLNNLSLGGVLHFGLDSKAATAGNVLDSFANAMYLPVFLELKQYITGFRGKCVLNEDEIYWHTLSTTTTSTITTSSSTTASTTTTT